jgi:hypothetical protein
MEWPRKRGTASGAINETTIERITRKMIDKQLAIDLQRARLAQDTASKALTAAIDQFRAEHPELYDAADIAKAAVTSADSALREAVLAEFKLTKQKTLDFGTGVKESIVISFPEDKALAWCKEEARIYVIPESLDSK